MLFRSAVVGMMGVETGDGAATPGVALGGFTSLIMCSANLPDKIAIAIDSQMDDGQPNAGVLRAQLQTTSNPDIVAAAASAYAETGTNVYTLCRAL